MFKVFFFIGTKALAKAKAFLLFVQLVLATAWQFVPIANLFSRLGTLLI